MIRYITCCVAYAEFVQISLSFSLLEYVDFKHLPRQKDKSYDEEDFAIRFRFKFTVFDMRLLVGLSWHLRAHITYI